MEIKSPFFVIHDFISPLFAEKLRDRCIGLHKSFGSKQHISRIKDDEYKNDIIQPFNSIYDEIIEYYELPKNASISPIFYNTIMEGGKRESRMVCDNGKFINGKWIRQNKHSLTIIVFLNDYNKSTPFDRSYEVYGGKYQFPQYNFGLLPKIGTLIAYPSGPNFLNNVAEVQAGACCYLQFFIDSDVEIVYNERKFPGRTHQWLEQIP